MARSIHGLSWVDRCRDIWNLVWPSLYFAEWTFLSLSAHSYSKGRCLQHILFCLTPHLAQPLDKTGFSPLKAAWKEQCRDYMISIPGKVVDRYVFSKLFAAAWSKAMTLANVWSRFRATGIYPFHRKAISLPAVDDESDVEVFPEETIILYTSLFIAQLLNIGMHHFQHLHREMSSVEKNYVLELRLEMYTSPLPNLQMETILYAAKHMGWTAFVPNL